MGAGLNLAHGMSGGGGVVRGVVMAVVSVAGVVAHQLVTAAPPRLSRSGRSARRLARQAERRVVRARRSASRSAVVALAADGTARLVYAPGRYLPRRRRLVAAPEPAPLDGWDAALADLLASPAEPNGPDPINGADQGGPDGGSGGVAVAERPSPAPTTPPRPAPKVRQARPVIDPKARVKLTDAEALKAARRLAREHGAPVTAELVRTSLRVGPVRACQLRDQVNREVYGS
ncbi:hypothetical protein [Candidatus Frankia alpina]|uniref:hypothetical protein n=1 Tax=Candidatus Frankia alpina TaxID=2699483 RepID=UPI001F20CE9E|nr:hypothetical protein [Candidatus Frankia alpina]